LPPIRDPNSRGGQQYRLPKKLRKRKWKIGAIKNFVSKHVFGYPQISTDEVTSSRAAEKHVKSPSTKEHRKYDKKDGRKDDDDDDDDEDDDVGGGGGGGGGEGDGEGDGSDGADAGKMSIWRFGAKTTERTKDAERNRKHDERTAKDRTNDRTSERKVNGQIGDGLEELRSEEQSLFFKIALSLESLSFAASDLNVVIFFFSLPWIRQIWR